MIIYESTKKKSFNEMSEKMKLKKIAMCGRSAGTMASFRNIF